MKDLDLFNIVQSSVLLPYRHVPEHVHPVIAGRRLAISVSPAYRLSESITCFFQ